MLDGPINGLSFIAWVEQFLVPTLKPGDIVIMDDLGSHKGQAVRQAIRSVGARLLFLPPYSPDLNPIEQVLAFGRLRLSPSSSSSCAKPPSALSKKHGNASAPSSTPSRLTKAPTTSGTQTTLQPK